MTRPYQDQSKPLKRLDSVDPAIIIALREDLRALGYLHSGISANWSDKLDDAILALRIDLTLAAAPAVIRAFNVGGKVKATPATGAASDVEPDFADVLAAMIADPKLIKLPKSPNPSQANRDAIAAVNTINNHIAPTPFMLAMYRQESGSQHYYVPTANNNDAYVVTGLDKNDKANPKRITSRGYGLGQFTIFHHPPTQSERQSFIVDPIGNVATAFQELRDKFDGFVVSPSPDRRADDRKAEFPISPLRLCRYTSADPRFMKDCRACAATAPKVNVVKGMPVFPGASLRFDASQYYADTAYNGVPDRRALGCDWPYAARRYNGSGINSFHYQHRILKNLLLV